MFEFLKQILSPKKEIEIKTVRTIKKRSPKKRFRVSAVLTENDFNAYKTIGNVVKAHKELGISTGVLYIWKKLGSWEKITDYKKVIAQRAKDRLHSN